MKYLIRFTLLISALFIFNDSNSQFIDCSLGILNPTSNCIKKSGQYLYIGTSNRGVYRSSNNGVDWEYKSNGMGPKYVECLFTDGPNIFAGTITAGLYYSSDYGESWIERGFNSTSFGHIYGIGKSGQNLVLSGLGKHYYSTNNGVSWIQSYIPAFFAMKDFTNLGDTIFGVNGSIFSSFDNGVSWTLRDSGNYTSILANNNTIYAGAYYGGVYKSTNRGYNWIPFNQGLPSGTTQVNALENHNGVLYATCISTIYYYSQTNSLWMPTNYVYGTGNTIFDDLISFENKLFTILYSPIHALYYTSNNGANWNKTRVVNHRLTSLYSFNNKLFACSDSAGVYSSTNNGDLWICDKISNSCFTSMTELNTNLFLSSADSGIYKSTNNGLNWSYTNNDIPNRNILSLNKKDSNVFAGSTNGLFYSSNSGTNWLSLGFSSKRISAIGVTDSLLLIGTNTGLYISTNNGTNWSSEFISGKVINVIKKYYNNIFVGSNENLYYASNSGLTWTGIGFSGNAVYNVIKFADTALIMATDFGICRSYNYGLTWKNLNWASYSLLDYNNYIYRGGNSEIAKAPKSELLTSILKYNNEILKDYNITQNYPNPFNPVTKIQFEVPKSSEIKIVIYNINGRKIELLVNQKYNSGNYEISWDASKYPSGVYFAKLITDNFSKTIKMLFIK